MKIKSYLSALSLVMGLGFNFAQASTSITVDDGFQATILPSEAAAQELFDEMRARDLKGSSSQCYRRATVWTLEAMVNHQIQLQRIYLFYTPSYQRVTREEWWFHVAPVALVFTDSGQVEERVLDATFLEGPVTIQEWTNKFITFPKPRRYEMFPENYVEEIREYNRAKRTVLRDGNANCPRVNTFTDDIYRGQMDRSYCFTRVVPAYYYDPAILENRDSGGAVRDFWECNELKDSYSDTLGRKEVPSDRWFARVGCRDFKAEQEAQVELERSERRAREREARRRNRR